MKPRGGRPRLAADDSSVNVHFRLTSKQYDRAYQQAAEARLPLGEWLRRVVAARAKPKV